MLLNLKTQSTFIEHFYQTFRVNSGFSILPEDALTHGRDKTGKQPVIYHLSHSHPKVTSSHRGKRSFLCLQGEYKADSPLPELEGRRIPLRSDTDTMMAACGLRFVVKLRQIRVSSQSENFPTCSLNQRNQAQNTCLFLNAGLDRTQ